jgi:hypothetical protein
VKLKDSSIRLILTISGLLGGIGLFFLTLLIETPPVQPQTAVAIREDFSSYPPDNCLSEGSSIGSWTVLSSEGCVKIEKDPAQSWLHMEPPLNRQALVAGPDARDFELVADMQMVTVFDDTKQFSMIVWNLEQNGNHYYFSPRAESWEIAKVTNGKTEVVSSSRQPSFPVGAWHRVAIIQREGKAEIRAGNVQLADVAVQTGGRIGFKSVSAHTHIANVYYRPLSPEDAN